MAKGAKDALDLFALNGSFVSQGVDAAPKGFNVKPQEVFFRFDLQNQAVRNYAKPSDAQRLKDIDYLERLAKRYSSGKLGDKDTFNKVARVARKYGLSPSYIEHVRLKAEEEKAMQKKGKGAPSKRASLPLPTMPKLDIGFKPMKASPKKGKAGNALKFLFGGK